MMAQLSFDLTNIVGQPTRTRADDVRMMFEPYNRTLQQWQMAKNDVSRVPGVNRLAFLQTQQQALLKQSSELATRLRNQQTAYLSSLNAARTAAIKAGGRGRGGPDPLKARELAIDAYKAAGQLQPESALGDFAMGMGTLDASLLPIATKLATTPDARESLRSGKAIGKLASLQLGEEEGKAFAASKAGYLNGEPPPNEMIGKAKRIADAVGMLNATMTASQGTIPASERAQVQAAIAKMYNLDAADVTADSLENTRNAVQAYEKDVAKDPQERTALQQLGAELAAMSGGAGAAGAGVGAQVDIPEIPKLSPDKQAALDKYLAALSDDGIAQVGERVGAAYQVGGTIEDDRLTEQDVAAGKAAYEEARETGAFTPEQAPLFDRRYVSLLRQQAESAETVARQQEAVLSDYEMDAVGRQRAMARQFLDMQNAAEGLRVPLAYEAYGSTFERQVMGEMMDIVRKEGELVYDTGALPTDRERRLGGRGSAARAPHRFAKQLYSMDQSRPGGVRQSDVIPLINKRFRDPRDQERALAYFLAMKEVDSIRSQTGARVEPGQPVQVAQEAQAAMQAVRPTPTPAAGTARRVATAPAPVVETPADALGLTTPSAEEFRRRGVTRQLDPSKFPHRIGESYDPLLGTGESPVDESVYPVDESVYSEEEAQADRTLAAMQAGMGRALRNSYFRQPDVMAPGSDFGGFSEAADVEAIPQTIDSMPAIIGPVTGLNMNDLASYEGKYGPAASLEYRKDMDAMTQGTGQDLQRILPRDLYELDFSQPYNGQVNAPQAGMNGNRNTGMPTKVQGR